MSKELLLPKFLTRDIAEFAVKSVLHGVQNSGISDLFLGLPSDPAIGSIPLRLRGCGVCGNQVLMLHTVILVPSLVNGEINPHLLYEHSEHKSCNIAPSNVFPWPYDFDDIARSKARQLWEGRNLGGTDIVPHLLMRGDAPFWGGVKRRGIVVATSGVQAHMDKMISGMVADLCIAMAHEEWLQSKDKKDDVELIS